MIVKALLTDKTDEGLSTAMVDLEERDLGEGDVTITVEWSTINYKDALALSGRAPIMQSYPMVGGIDLVGIVKASDSPAFEPGDRVLVNGWGLGV
ncbi:alcohol dehydrogenase catalytic domain-containing protein [Xanthobacter wiegelii]|uniref:alcohol dehydrogenase catalytic domain-containing protein n=1 Tax=Xanthobacter wiegelii TaxID=3119913 RepID=UPI0037265207